jgi:probable rRNA maturation factor
MSHAAVVGYDEQVDHPVDLERWIQLAQDVLAAEGADTGELTLLFVDEQAMRELNELHMGEASATDVLSFPIDDEAVLAELVDDVPVMLGDVVICPAVAVRNAPEHAGTVADELALLVVHGVLHVLGHDHADPDTTVGMQHRERTLLEQHHWRGPAPGTFDRHRSTGS